MEAAQVSGDVRSRRPGGRVGLMSQGLLWWSGEAGVHPPYRDYPSQIHHASVRRLGGAP